MNQTKLYKEITLRLDAIHIKDLLKINNIIINGFRPDRKLTGIKLNGVRHQLSNREHIQDYINKLLKYYSDTNKYDFSWAIVSSVTIEEVKRKVEEGILKEGTMLLALLWAERENILLDYLLISTEDAEKESILNSNRPFLNDGVDKSSEKEKLIDSLREIIKELERNNNKNKSLLTQKDQDIHSLNVQVLDFERQTTQLKNKLKDKSHEIESLNELIKSLREKIDYITSEHDNVLQSKKLHLTCIGSKHAENFFEYYLKNKKNIVWEFISPDTLYLLSNYVDRQLVILANTLNKNETSKLINSSAIKHYNSIGRVKICDNAPSFIEFVEKVGKIYE